TIVTRLVDEGRVHAVFGMGGSGGSQLISGVMRATAGF
ncbi:MAG: Tm-1-like ATP-binding domain-containing protein, partial [Candidatus Omnitrophica bacterium]|nr:Tm-1-like ATP-binding domain-containing protein [Candidatus Omnitrophota bacterium]